MPLLAVEKTFRNGSRRETQTLWNTRNATLLESVPLGVTSSTLPKMAPVARKAIAFFTF
jgi:hypothetical protein